ncbi:MAG: PDZ domain-containing protein [bacterium]|nr:MAG: PDZ domain-containing protein [bacterium]
MKIRKYIPIYIAISIFLLFFTTEQVLAYNNVSNLQSKSQTSVLSDKGKSIAQQLSRAFEFAAEQVGPAVVPIYAEQEIEVSGQFELPIEPLRDFFGDEFLKQYFGRSPDGGKQLVQSIGSGVILTSDGYILTNNHVIENASNLTVLLKDGVDYPAIVIGTDTQTDLAVIKIDAHNLSVARLGNSDSLKIGQWVIAVGNPLQLLHTVTAGIISAKGRSSVGIAEFEDFIQTDASINPGNSGGALADLDGNVIGINTAIGLEVYGHTGIGFAIPINMAKEVMNQLITNGKVSRGYIGIVFQEMNPELVKALNLKVNTGALVSEVKPDGPGFKANIKPGDVIIKFNDFEIKNIDQIRKYITQTKPGTIVRFTLMRGNQQLQLNVTLAERPNPSDTQPLYEIKMQQQIFELLGLGIQTITPDNAQKFGDLNIYGVVVIEIAQGSPAQKAGLQVGDIIVELNQAEIHNVLEFTYSITQLKTGDTAALRVRRGQNLFFIALAIP